MGAFINLLDSQHWVKLLVQHRIRLGSSSLIAKYVSSRSISATSTEITIYEIYPLLVVPHPNRHECDVLKTFRNDVSFRTLFTKRRPCNITRSGNMAANKSIEVAGGCMYRRHMQSRPYMVELRYYRREDCPCRALGACTSE